MKTPQLSHNFTLCNIRILYLLAVLPALISCSSGDDDTIEQQNTCNSGKNLINSFENEHGTNLIYEDGKYFILNNDTCEFILQYFDPNYLEVNYTNTTQGIFVGTNPNELIPITNNNIEDLEGYTSFSDLFLLSFDMPEKFWTSMTLLSPATPTITEYSALKNCILNNTCDFIDNKIELINDPSNAANTAIQFSAVAPSPELVTSKASIPSTLAYFIKNNEIWYEADYYLKEGMPYSLIDLENGYFFGSPGPRVVIKDGMLALENKFGSKILYTQNNGVSIPENDWFTLKLHLKYSDTTDGIIELWQDDVLIINTAGINLPTSNSVQNSIEIGITATDEASIIFMDNIRISDTEF